MGIWSGISELRPELNACVNSRLIKGKIGILAASIPKQIKCKLSPGQKRRFPAMGGDTSKHISHDLVLVAKFHKRDFRTVLQISPGRLTFRL